ncbi:hypothetical protein DFQ28_000260 [Apophysomyces sp. BC1034]|nr:hypothetical protein DFQ30_000496 [Apophysomyces sp. BC1015]KAG0168044.1 hypothetical protein DFQ29_000141 [Apophysomyces sp. BC1021]KAG0184025.1 hypothetical protein DFQ28_000260 [Apophysomyces sp. BC1034]
MSQMQTVQPQPDGSLSKAVNTASINLAQVAPQEPSKSKAAARSKHINPEYVKSPLPATSDSSRPNSRSGSLKASFGSKGGFLSLLLCCTVGAGSFLDNSDKSSGLQGKRGNRHSRASTTTTTGTSGRIVDKAVPVPFPDSKNEQKPSGVPKINTSVTANVPLPAVVEQEASGDSDVTSATPVSAPQSSPEGHAMWLLPPISPEDHGRKCLVLDLDETLVHSSFKIIPNPDFIVPVEIDRQYHNVYVLKRPGVDEFMRRMGELYEIVIFTASLAKYADPVLNMLDVHKVVRHRLFRESCFNHKGTYVKDLSQLGRDLSATLILDNSPASYIFHTSNAVPVSTWFNDPHDTELSDLVAFLEDLTEVDDVTQVLDSTVDTNLTTD